MTKIGSLIGLFAVLGHSDATNGLELEYFANDVLHGPPACSLIIPSLNIEELVPPADCGIGPADLYSARISGTLVVPSSQWYRFSVVGSSPSPLGLQGFRGWVDDVMLFDSWPLVRFPLAPISNITLQDEVGLRIAVRARGSITFNMQWAFGAQTTERNLPSSSFSPVTSRPQQERMKLQSELAQGWNHWYRHSMLAQVLLPHQLGVDLGVWNKLTGEVYMGGLVQADHTARLVQPGLHTYDGSYSELRFSPFDGLNISVEAAHAEEGDLVLLISYNCTSVLAASGQAGSFALVAYPQAYYGAAANVSVQSGSAVNLPALSLEGTVGVIDGFFSAVASDGPVVNSISFDLSDSGNIGVSLSLASRSSALPSIVDIVARQRAAALARVAAWGDLAWAYDAQMSVVGWNTNFDPRVSVFSPVSRTFEGNFDVLFFDWDTYFGAYMMSLDNRELAYSNLIEVTQTRSVYGFVPNKRTEGSSCNDRTEPYVGAQVTLRLFERYGDAWLVELLFPTLLRWNQWAWEKRRYGSYDLLVLGSDVDQLPKENNAVGSQRSAILESGMDNSPMYDGASYDSNAHRLLMWDVGMSSLFLAENRALVQLAKAINRVDVLQMLDEQFARMSAAVDNYLWDDEAGIYANRHINVDSGEAMAGDFVRRYSPTSFYPLLTGIPDDAKLARMLDGFLTNSSEFCVSTECEFALPSISRSDPNFLDNTYWRGRSWGPLTLLTHMSLSEVRYASNEAVTKARARLCQQGLNTVWQDFNSNRHIHENYNATTGLGGGVADSNPYYHWGALNTFVSFIEDGHFGKHSFFV